MTVPRRPSIVVIGGGITGLTASRVLREALVHGGAGEVTLIEAAPQLGGKILTERVGGFLIEGGPDSFLTLKPQAVELARELGLGDRLVGTLDPRHVFILHRGRLHPLPEGLASLIPQRLGPFIRSRLFTPWEKARFGLDLLIPPSPNGTDEALGSFVRRRLGQAAVERLAGPLLAGIHAGDIEELSLRATFPTLAEAERRYGSLTRAVLARRRAPARSGGRIGAEGASPGGSMFMTLRGGLRELVDRAADLPGVAVRTQTDVRTIERRGERYLVRVEGAEAIEADVVLVTVPANAAAVVLRDLNPPAADLAATVPHVSTAAVAFGFRRADVRHPLAGHGYVVGLGEGMAHTAATWVSSKWPDRAPEGYVLLRCFTGRAGEQQALALDDGALAEALLAEVTPLLGITGAPELTRVYRWNAAMPQYTLGHLERVAALRRALEATPGIIVAGGGYGGVGLPDCIRQGREAAAEALRLAAPPALEAVER